METYEEVVGRALEVLYPGALFLTGGNDRQAEELVASTVTTGFYSDLGEAEPLRWFEDAMALEFLREQFDIVPARLASFYQET